MIHVIADISVAEGRREDFLVEFRKLVPEVLAEDGCVRYEPTVDITTDICNQADEQPNVVTVVESWESVDALKAHLAAPHMTAFREKMADVLQGLNLRVVESVM